MSFLMLVDNLKLRFPFKSEDIHRISTTGVLGSFPLLWCRVLNRDIIRYKWIFSITFIINKKVENVSLVSRVY